MNLSRPFIERPVATTLLSLGIALAGLFAFARLPVAPLPQVDFPTISVQASLPGASPDTVANSVASPLERHLGQIADVTEMTSQSSVGMTRITLQFGLDRNIDGAARDVQAAINAARADLPSSLKSNPTYRKVNPADAPVLILSLTSHTLTQAKLYDLASTILVQSLSQLPGVGEVDVNGSANPAVRVELNPTALYHYGIGLEDVRAALASANANSPKGIIESEGRRFQLYANDQASTAAQYRNLVIAYRNGAAVRLSDVAQVVDSVEDLRNLGLAGNNQPAVLVMLYRQPGANIISTVDGIRASVAQLKPALPADVDILEASDRSTTIRASLHDTETTLLIAVALVILVVFFFLGSARAALIPGAAVPVSIVGTFAVMYLLGYSIDNLSLMALTVATGFVVDDAIVVLENIARHLEAGKSRMQAALLGAREVGFTVLSISISLIAVFIPILLMGGIIGRLFREFAVTLSVAILVSLAVSLTTTPMMCSRLLASPKRHNNSNGGNASRMQRLAHLLTGPLQCMREGYARTLDWSLRHPLLMMSLLLVTIALNVFLYIAIPKGFFPQEDTGRLIGGIQGDQSVSFQAMETKLKQLMQIVRSDPAVASVVGFTGGRQTNTGFVFVSLKPLSQRNQSADEVIARLRPALNEVAGARLYLQPVQDIRVGGRQSNAQYQLTLLGDTSADVYKWAPRLTRALQSLPELADVNSDQQQGGLEADVDIDRATAARLGITPAQIDNTLYDAFGQRLVSTIYNPMNQYYVVMEVAPRYWQHPQTLNDLYVSTSGGTQSTNFVAGTVSGPTAASTSQSSSNAAQAAGIAQAVTTPGGTAMPTEPVAASTSAASATSADAASSTSAASDVTVTLPTAGATPFALAVPALNSTRTGGTTSTTTSSAATVAADSARNLAINSLAASGHSGASAGTSVSTAQETMIPFSAFARFKPGHTALGVNHQGSFVATTISFNLPPHESLSTAMTAINRTMTDLGMPASLHASFEGTARTFQQSLSDEPLLVAAALLSVYIVLGVLYESYAHPLTILSTLPSAGVGALLALMLFRVEFTVMSLIGVILLIGIVKKNAIMMVDFAIDASRSGMSPRDAIYHASLMRFRPIMMTTCAALLGALPLALGNSEGADLRRPLGISIVGGLIVSQILTLYTTPVVYLYVDRLGAWVRSRFARRVIQ
ncbi:Cobalt-zinc-cadmium resistance protein CzcA (plasmid) [Paraburkholderia caribensis MBA4]|uniref:Cobalt-zinc-cadmium resistance protein CzcA n=1 Tax=Paraburkholderia caribensis MBA4 TaxID=1323664 RepID=A0A0P0RLX2_9BURK|nr:efflux RND transporter permease subunit [Paraburkholderia caribensis]ALL69787.1 Cobalt-zinc-cadmium resistance protein CzcA [Paraburkholderia caribensis MBA4]